MGGPGSGALEVTRS